MNAGLYPGCSRCGFAVELYVKGTSLCAGCGLETGAGPQATAREVFEQEQRTRARMLARKGTAAHLVRKGLT